MHWGWVTAPLILEGFVVDVVARFVSILWSRFMVNRSPRLVTAAMVSPPDVMELI